MAEEISQEELLKSVLNRVIQNNQQLKPGTPLAELKEAIEAALTSLPPLEFEEFSRAIDNRESIEELVKRAPEMIGWDADHIVEWVEALGKKLR